MSEGAVVLPEGGDAPVIDGGTGAEPTAAPSWSDSFAPDIKDHPVTQRLESAEAGIRELIGAQKMIGADKVVIPGEDATPEEIDAFQTRMGRPAKVEDYDLADVSIPEGLPIEEGLEEEMVSRMHKLGLSQDAVKGILNNYYELTGGQFEQMGQSIQQQIDEGVTVLKNEWGKSFEGQKQGAITAFKEAAGDRIDAISDIKLEGGGKMIDHPEVIRAFANIGGKMSEHGLVGERTTRTTPTPGEATAQMNSLYADADFMKAYTTKGHPEHAMAVKRINDLTHAEVGDGTEDYL